MSIKRKLFIVLALAFLIWILGIFGFVKTAEISYSESIYQVTHMMINHFDNYGFVDNASRILVIIISFSSLLIIAYLVKILLETGFIFRDNYQKSRQEKQLKKYQNHYIVCGLGRVGEVVLEQFKRERVSAVGIDVSEPCVRTLLKKHENVVLGDPTNELDLERVGVDRAKGVVICLSDDSDNMMIALIARQLNPNIDLVVRLNNPSNKSRFERVGVHRLVIPQEIGGYHLALKMLRPEVVDYLSIDRDDNFDQTQKVAEIILTDDKWLDFEKLNLAIRRFRSIKILAILSPQGTVSMKLEAKNLEIGTKLIVIGEGKDILGLTGLL